MKRTMSLFLCVFILLSTISPSFGDSSTDWKIQRLIDGGLILGDQSGLRLSSPITRAEIATLICRLLDLEDVARASQVYKSPFKDIPSTFWGTGYINVVTGQGIFGGYPDSTFRPNQNISYAETIAVLVRTMGGLSPEEESNISWPSTYINKAMKLGILDDLGGRITDFNTAATRENVFLMVYNSIMNFGIDHTAAEVFSYQEPTPAKPTIREVKYEWDYPLGYWTWSYKLPIPVDAVDLYKSIDRADIYGYSYYVTHTEDDEYLNALAQVFINTGEENDFSEWDMLSLVVSFVQSLKYVPDDIGTGYDEYPKFPLETLYDQGGDCEDSSILLASLLRELGYGTVLVATEDHMGVGLKAAEEANFTYLGMDFYYIETTDIGWEIGQLPDELDGASISIIPLN
ncbi:S-layer homology domain-containing protein [Tissierella creatinini]|nr:S-layer homology domain-containing protein [Tissierella creatinini]TJX60683.1 S-layer homology domain-containing protein [Soehngenia saccharolytica]